jgi:hypothetical protein
MDPQLYFMQLLMNLPSWPASDLDAWLPDREVVFPEPRTWRREPASNDS